MPKKLYKVESIIDCKNDKNGQLYLVKWEGYPRSEATWEPLKHLLRVTDLIDQFNDQKQLESKKRLKSKSERKSKSKSKSDIGRRVNSESNSKSVVKKSAWSRSPLRQVSEEEDSVQAQSKPIDIQKSKRKSPALLPSACVSSKQSLSVPTKQPSLNSKRPIDPLSKPTTSAPKQLKKVLLPPKSTESPIEITQIIEESNQMRVEISLSSGKSEYWSFDKASREATQPLIAFLKKHIRFDA